MPGISKEISPSKQAVRSGNVEAGSVRPGLVEGEQESRAPALRGAKPVRLPITSGRSNPPTTAKYPRQFRGVPPMSRVWPGFNTNDEPDGITSPSRRMTNGAPKKASPTDSSVTRLGPERVISNAAVFGVFPTSRLAMAKAGASAGPPTGMPSARVRGRPPSTTRVSAPGRIRRMLTRRISLGSIVEAIPHATL